MSWALDIGNSHTRVARWPADGLTPELLELPAICRAPGAVEPLVAPRLVPTATEILDPPDWKARIGQLPGVRERFFLGRRARIGRPALERSLGEPRAGFSASFKPWLDRRATEVLTRTRERAYTAREVAAIFLRELLAEIHRASGERLRELVVTTPVGAFETYRAELQLALRSLGVRRVRFVDEPVAAALGYGLSLSSRRQVLVVDFGSGSLDLALVALEPRGLEEGRAEVVAKAERPLGGHLVDRWVLESLGRTLGFAVGPEPATTDEERFWRRVMTAEARRVKEALYFQPWTVFHALPPGYLRAPPAPGAPDALTLEIPREQLVALLEEKRLAARLLEALDDVLEAAADRGIREADVAEVLMVGGSTLLPGVYALFEARFGRDRVRAWQPFEAVARGAAVLAAGRFSQSDLIAHDYAFLTHDAESGRSRPTVVIPAGTRVPTSPQAWSGKVVPTCALGQPEEIFKLVICEIARGDRVAWDENAQAHPSPTTAEGDRIVVPLNADDPVLGKLEPPHPPHDRSARLEVAFGVDAERWLLATVDDLRSGRRLLDGRRVVRLL